MLINLTFHSKKDSYDATEKQTETNEEVLTDSTVYMLCSVGCQLGQCKQFSWLSTVCYCFCGKDSELENSPYLES